MKRRRRSRAHSNHERWLVSYADFITLLFAFFVVLYSSAQVDKRKMGKLSSAIQEAFQEFGVGPSGKAERLINSIPLDAAHAIEQANRASEKPTAALPAVAVAIPSEPSLNTLQYELKLALQDELSKKTVALHRESEGLVITLREFGFFDSGSVALRPEAMPALDRIASVLAVRTYRLRVEGHTDNIPIHTKQIASNWELSTTRSTEIVRLLIQHYRFSPDRLSAAGYAEYHPITSNETPEGRAQNRRIDIVVLAQRAAP